jgi:hypothetical protein
MKSQLSNKHLACVTWDDAHISLDEYNQGEIDRDVHKACRVNSFGLVVADTAAGVTLAMQEGVEDTKYRHVNFIPRGMIVEVIDLGIPKKKLIRKRKGVVPDEQGQG